MQKIGNFSLFNQGGFVTKLQFVYWDNEGNKIHKDGTGDITLGKSQSAKPGDHGVPNGAMVALYAFVVWGDDNEAAQVFTLDTSSEVTANYTISGTTLDNALVLNSVE